MELTHYIVHGRYVTGKTVSSKNIDGTHPELHLSPNPETLDPVLLRLAMRPRGHCPPWPLVLSHLDQVLFDWHNIGQPNWKHMALVLFLICWTSPARNRHGIISFYETHLVWISLVCPMLVFVLFDWHIIGQPNWKHMALVLFLICWTSPARNRKWIISFY